MIAASSPPASWTRSVVALWSSCVVVTGALWLASAPLAPREEAAVVVDVPADGEEERDFAAAANANVFDAARGEAVAAPYEALGCGGWGVVVEGPLTPVEQLASSARFVPAFESGRVVGLKIFSIRPTSFLDTHGFANGDVVTRINGRDLNGLEATLEAYNLFLGAHRFVVDAKRRGQPITLTFIVEENPDVLGEP